MTLAEKLASLRLSSGEDGKVVADGVKVTPSVISKWERGERIPSDDTLKQVGKHFGLGATQVRELVDLAHQERNQRPRKRRSRNEFKRSQENVLAAEANASEISQYENILVPAALQTPQFTRVVLQAAGLSSAEVDDLRELRMKRADLLYDDGRTFRFLIDEAVFQRLKAADQDHLLGDPARTSMTLERSVAHAQINHLLHLAGEQYENVQIRILPRQQIGRLTMFGGFRIYDDRAVSIETRTDLVWETDPSKVAEYVDDFQLAWDHTAPGPVEWMSEGQSTSELLDEYLDELTQQLAGANPRHASARRR